ncbi:Starch-binding associating with outer membrane [Sphingobacterium spiritivorum]|uniref:Starch-binding associating with outer membrane n=1 Tax=Sphingobacterium spiritivorum TaxID=258 RepID=A0A380BA68_SPHSI|nr:SusD/RagB family nutrient-binding outer membrane lipoprotein [Sphingobacterium spiritivorum]SUI97377.1 Starch-binding associating with outer membrane [Sphingobacterium spiritivorum]
MKSTKILLVVLIVGLLTSCKKYLDINDNPSFPQDAKAELLLAPIVYQMANGYSQDARIINKFTQGIVGGSSDFNSLVWERHGYIGGVSDVGGVMWRMVYYNHGHNLRVMLEDAIKNEKYEYAAIGYAIKAWGYQMLTDYHGPVILDEALRNDLLKFKYQDQPEVYAKVRQWCDSSLYYMTLKSPLNYSANLNSASGDNLYRGNMDRWKKFVYGILALQYSHLVNKPEFSSQYADSVIRYADLSFTSAADDAGVKFGGKSPETSNIFGTDGGYLNSTYYSKAGLPILRYLTGGVRGDFEEAAKTSLDPRLSRMLNFRLPDSTFIGGTPNISNSTVPSVVGGGGKFIFKNTVDFPLMTYSQLQFAKAEAMLIKGDRDGAFAAYRNGITAHMSFVSRYAVAEASGEKEITATEIGLYLASTEVAQTAAELTITDIMGQKYIAQWGWGSLEQWCDLRKYHYDATVFRQYQQIDPSTLVYKKYGYRVRPRYNSEYVWNADELAKWGGLEPDYVTKELWFSKSTD